MRMIRVAVAIGVFGWVQAGIIEARAQPATPAEGTPDMPRRRPEEAQGDPMLAFDVNKDGKLQLAEVKSAAAARYDELNPDLDDKLDRKEALGVLSGTEFRAADPDGDGTINKAEYLAYVERLFRRANPDKDGTLERKELNTPAGKALMRLLR